MFLSGVVFMSLFVPAVEPDKKVERPKVTQVRPKDLPEKSRAERIKKLRAKIQRLKNQRLKNKRLKKGGTDNPTPIGSGHKPKPKKRKGG